MPDVIHVSSVAGSPLLDSAGERLGRVEDVVVRIDQSGGLPPVIGLKVRIGGREMFVPIARIDRLGPDAVTTSTTKLNLAQFERRPGEVLVREDMLDHSLINVATARLVAAREVEIVHDEHGVWRVAGIDPSFRPRLWRLLPRSFRGHDSEHRQFISWTDLEPFVSHVPTSRLKLAARLRRLHPAQLADLVEAASHEEGEEILEAVGEDKELEADVFEELDDEHQVEFLRERSDREAAEVLSRMEPDDAADLLLELDQERRLPILNLMPAAKQRKIRNLLGFNPSTAGGLMNPDFISVRNDATVGDALGRVRRSDLGPRQLTVVCVVDDRGCLAGVVSLPELVRAGEQERLEVLMDEVSVPTVAPEADLPEVAMVMTDYNLVALPVIEDDGRPVGVIAVDDVLELLVPEEWRRRAGAGRS